MKTSTKILSLLMAAALLLYSGFALLDTFVIRRLVEPADSEAEANTYQLDSLSSQISALPLALSAVSALEPEQEIGSYRTDGLKIVVSRYRYEETDVYVAEVWTASPAALLSALADDSYGRNIAAATSQISAANNAILAVNGDNYGAREKGYVIRNGVLYRDSAAKGQEDLAIFADGSFRIFREDEISAAELMEQGAMQVYSFGPGLLEDGEITVSAYDEVDRAMVSNPRTAIGFVGSGHLVFVVSDGRTSLSEGLSLYELASFLRELGVQTAYNLDGGGSSTMVFRGQVLNRPTSGRGRSSERSVTDIVYIADI